MNCDPLPTTGLGADVGLFLIIAIGCVVLGVIALLAARRRHTGAAACLMILSVASMAFAISPGAPAQAAISDCDTTENSLTVMQTSTIDGLAPGLPPVAITGLVVNNSLDSTHITAVEVEITSVTTHPGSGPGVCDASDFLLLNTRMVVEQTLGPGGSTPFTGAAIGLKNKTTNQDACQHAVLHLRYTANPD